jgi:hypothetical protein
MFAQRLVFALAVAVLVAGCVATPVPPAPPPTQPVNTAPAPPVSTDPTQPATQPSTPRPVPDLLARPAEGAVQRAAFKSGDVIGTSGVYFLNAATGAGESWLLPGGPAPWYTLISDDNRFVITNQGEDGFLIDRQTGTIWQWDPQTVRLRLADATGFLFAEVEPRGSNQAETGRYFWTGPDFKPHYVFTLGGDGAWISSPLLSPDGQRLALLRWASQDAPPQLDLLNLTSGEVQTVTIPGAGRVSTAGLRRYGQQIQVELLTGDFAQWETQIRRFTWTGETAKDLRLPGNYVFFSPDGRWIAWEEWPAGDLAPATVVADANTLQPRLRALGATPCFQATGSGGTRWLADSSALVVDTGSGYRLLTPGGDLQDRPAFAGQPWSGEPQPAPDDPDRFALGRTTVLNGDGTQRLGVSLQGFVTPVSLNPWGATSSELRFALPPPGKGGACGERSPLPVAVQIPADPLPPLSLVTRTADKCLTLRDAPHSSGTAIACLPDGTRLAPLRNRSDSAGITWSDQSWWLYVKTEQGVAGWISLTGNPITWAVP